MAELTFYEFAQTEIKKRLIVNTDYINGKAADVVDPYLHLSKLEKMYSPTRKWETLSTNNIRVMADIVSLDSPFPLKRRPGLTLKSGDIEKIASKSAWNETEQQELREWMLSSNDMLKVQAMNRITDDVAARQFGVHEKLEAILYQLLSNDGVAIYATNTDPANVAAGAKDNVGLGIRMDLGFTNGQTAAIPWTDPTNSTPLDDIRKVVDAARKKGFRIMEAHTDQVTIDRLLNSNQLKNAMASANLALSMAPTLAQANVYILANFGFTFAVRDHIFFEERDGIQTQVEMWNEGAIAFMGSNTWGQLVWTECVEMWNPASGYQYERPEDMILIGMYREKLNGASWMQITEGQGIIVPVVNPERIITLSTIAAV